MLTGDIQNELGRSNLSNKTLAEEMKKRGLILIWPILTAPLASVATVLLSGPTYTTAPNQGAMVIRFLGMIAWFIIASVGCLLTPLVINAKNSKNGSSLLDPQSSLPLFSMQSAQE